MCNIQWFANYLSIFKLYVQNKSSSGHGVSEVCTAGRIASYTSLLMVILVLSSDNGLTFKSPFIKKIPSECIKIVQLYIIETLFSSWKLKINDLH